MIEIYWKRKNKSEYTICSEPIILDIETAHKDDKCWMVSCQVKFAGSYDLLRTPTEVMTYLLDKVELFRLNEKRKIAVYIHNASYDLSYLLPWIQLMLPGYETRNGIYDGRNKIIIYSQGPFDFRCSYLLSGCSLERWSDEMNAKHKKKVGLYDYSKLLYQDSELSEDESQYDEYDVLALEDSLRAQMEYYGDDMSNIPLTSTGYIRRILRRSCSSDKDYRTNIFLRSRLDAAAYNVVLPSYSGGYTHENRFKKGKTIVPDADAGEWIEHDDFRSHYPTQIMVQPLPWGQVDHYYNISDRDSYTAQHGHDMRIEDLFELYPAYTTISRIAIEDMSLKDKNITMPFMQISKMFNKSEHFRVLNDNGRAIRTFGRFTTCIDNLTLKIISEQYHFSYVILDVYRFENDVVPDAIAEVINDLFRKKSDFKIAYQQAKAEYGESSEEAINALFKLTQTKKLLNAVYGCLATNPIRSDDDVDYISFFEGESEDPYSSIKPLTDEAKQAKLDKYYNSRNSFLPYQVGVMVTAAARYELYEYIKTIGYENILYGDTDSLFYICNDEIKQRVDTLNAEKHKTAPFVVNSEGKLIYYDVFEPEAEVRAFRGLHSKCYAIIEHNSKHNTDELIATIAGVPKRTIIGMSGDSPIYLTREEELAGISIEMRLAGEDSFDPYEAINNLYDGFTFKVNTGFTAKYIHERPHAEEIDGHMIETAGGCIIKRLPEKIIKDMNMIDYDVEFSDMYIEGV